LRSGASNSAAYVKTSGGSIAVLPKDTVLSLTGEQAATDGKWFAVLAEFKGEQVKGYVPADSIALGKPVVVTPEPTPTPTATPVPEITTIQAMNLAYQDAGVTTKDAKLTKLTYLSVDREYHIEFTVGLFDYVYVLSSVDGRVIRKEMIDNTVTEQPEDNTVTEAKITADKALNLALEKAGVRMAELTKCDIKYHSNKKDGAEFNIHFHVDKDHYETIVNALTGEVTEKAKPKTKEEKPGPADKEEPLKPHEKDEAEKPTPVPPHEKEEPKKPVGPKEKAEAEKPVPPHEKDAAKVTVTLEK
jgi:hypothetical protein